MISLTPQIMSTSFRNVLRFVLEIALAWAFLEAVVYVLFHRPPKNALMGLLMLLLAAAVVFLVGRYVWPNKGLDIIKKAAAGLLFLLGYLTVYWALGSHQPSKVSLAYLLLAPGVVGIAALIIYPFLFNVYLAFSNMALTTTRTYTISLAHGIDNFRSVFTGVVAHDATFWQVLVRTIVWTAINVVFHVSGGMALALLLNRQMRFRGIYRTLLIFPWAIPQTIACLALRSEFNQNYGFFNAVLSTPFMRGLGLHPVNWLTDAKWAFVALCVSNIWLGIPFMMVIILGGLQSISKEFYEASEIDGASGFDQFRNITIPLLRPVLTPSIVLGTVWTFNALNVVYLITGGNPQEKTDILVSSLYRAAFDFYRYGFAAAFGLVIFGFLLAFALVYIKASGGLKAAYE
jgi:arabinogalactan oligomer/maltooligosaccharide transport system permease protein